MIDEISQTALTAAAARAAHLIVDREPYDKALAKNGLDRTRPRTAGNHG